MLTGLAWMGAVLLVSANQKDVSLGGDLAYDRANRANRVHTLALVLVLATASVIHRTGRAYGLSGRRATTALVVAAVLMLAGDGLGDVTIEVTNIGNFGAAKIQGTKLTGIPRWFTFDVSYQGQVVFSERHEKRPPTSTTSAGIRGPRRSRKETRSSRQAPICSKAQSG